MGAASRCTSRPDRRYKAVGKFRDVESCGQLELADIGAVRIERLGLKDMPGSLNFDLLRRGL
jgi:hypothetical protein